jgi:FMN phosphatase YigB (HAD superfamily)
MLAAIGLDAYFDQLIIGEECRRAKPHPDPYEVFPNDAAHSKRPTRGAHGLL